jgi:hypothetical protein
VSLLRADVAALLPIAAFDVNRFSLAPIEDDIVRFAQDVSSLAGVILKEIDRRISLATGFFNDHDSSAVAADQVQAMASAARALLGDDFRIFPEFAITAAQGDEFANALAASRSGDLFRYLTAPPEAGRDPLDFPIDTWLYGVARVREKMFAWEKTVMFSEALGVPEHKLDPLQLPFTPGDRWLAMEFPPDQKFDKDHLLYTAHFAATFNKTARQSGLLIDEWTETIPASSIDTGVTFHFNRPNSEAPQAMLLVTPSDFRGAWSWDDLVDALNQTFDLAKRRAIEPSHIDNTPYAPFLPATAVATQAAQLTIALELSLNNKIAVTTGNRFITGNLGSVIGAKSVPGITIWNRLEGRSRADNFDRALRAEVRDPLWMLTRQWQMGEFQGDDAGSPIFAKIQVQRSALRKFDPAQGPVLPFDESIPLEAQVERLPIAFNQTQVIGGAPTELDISLDIRLLMGRQWLKMISPLAPESLPQFIAAYPVHRPDPTQAADFAICAHTESWSNFQAAATRLVDGAKLYLHLVASPSNHASDGIAALSGKEAQVDPIAKRFVAWFQRLFYQPSPGQAASSWLPDRLEYQFSASAPLASGEKVLVAEQYSQGHLDWFNFDVDPDRQVLGTPLQPPAKPARLTFTMLPAQVTFSGMPNTRWWRFEDGRTNFGEITPDTTDLAKLLLIEFGLVYANDWFLVPFTMPTGSEATIGGAAVTNIFGERIWVEAAGSGPDDDWQRWAMFLLPPRASKTNRPISACSSRLPRNKCSKGSRSMASSWCATR